MSSEAEQNIPIFFIHVVANIAVSYTHLAEQEWDFSAKWIGTGHLSQYGKSVEWTDSGIQYS